MKTKKKVITILLFVIGGLVIMALGGLAAYLMWEKPPALPEQPEAVTPVIEATPEPTVTPEPTPTPEPMPEGTAFENSRKDGVYTMLLVGLDQMSGSTDTILVGRFDTQKHEVNLVSIPRDTITNTDSDVRKINSVYAGSLNWGGNGIDSLMTQIDWLMGFTPDCYAILNLNTFIEIIDELGGVDFDVPEEMEYMYGTGNAASGRHPCDGALPLPDRLYHGRLRPDRDAACLSEGLCGPVHLFGEYSSCAGRGGDPGRESADQSFHGEYRVVYAAADAVQE